MPKSNWLIKMWTGLLNTVTVTDGWQHLVGLQQGSPEGSHTLNQHPIYGAHLSIAKIHGSGN